MSTLDNIRILMIIGDFNCERNGAPHVFVLVRQ